ncbi:MAG: redoxin family protein [Deltaproteobacteria bacterium]|nr:redoxin family protein [Deltaproteobacteria bacterium]
MVALLSLLSTTAIGLAAIGPDTVFTGRELVTGKALSLAARAPKRGTVLVFLSSRCPCSAGHEKAVTDLYNEYAAKGFAFLGVHANANEPEAEARAHFERSKLPFQVVQDDGARLADELGALKTPHAFVVAPGGELLFSGGVDEVRSGEAPKHHYLASALQAVSQGKLPEPREVRTLGCKIERP